jgi:hypothetical protein
MPKAGLYAMDRTVKEPDPKAEMGTGQSGTERVLCLDFKTGETLWTQPN